MISPNAVIEPCAKTDRVIMTSPETSVPMLVRLVTWSQREPVSSMLSPPAVSGASRIRVTAIVVAKSLIPSTR
jgi:hypothetical protein